MKSNEIDEIQSVEVVGTEKYQLPTIPKTTLKNVDKCRDYILKFVLGYSRSRLPDKEEKTSEFDDWGIQFLPILFEGKSIKLFNTVMYLETLKAQQDDEYYQIVQIRWQAIQAHFSESIICLKTALRLYQWEDCQRDLHWRNFITATIPLNKDKIIERNLQKKKEVLWNECDKKILSWMKENSHIIAYELSGQIGVGVTTITEHIRVLRERAAMPRAAMPYCKRIISMI